jgi:nitroimidazol reductase NimA-like FMN-containing flavoprotein (pyridoxamine 5'-phosphate oxidase superfamily)
VRKHKREIKSREEVEEVLGLARVMRLALSVGDMPYVVPLNFGYRDGRVYFHCAQAGRKLEMIRENSNVSFEVESDVELITGELPCEWTTHFRSVIGFGKATVVEDLEEKRLGMDVLMAHHKAKPGEYDAHNFKLAAIVRIDITEMTGKKYLG